MDSEFQKYLSRRQVLRKGAGAAALLACGAWQGALRAQGVATGVQL